MLPKLAANPLEPGGTHFLFRWEWIVMRHPTPAPTMPPARAVDGRADDTPESPARSIGTVMTENERRACAASATTPARVARNSREWAVPSEPGRTWSDRRHSPCQ